MSKNNIIECNFSKKRKSKSKSEDCKVLSIVTNCALCNKDIIKSKKVAEDLCKDCQSLSDDDIYDKIVDSIDETLMTDPIFDLDDDELELLFDDEDLNYSKNDNKDS